MKTGDLVKQRFDENDLFYEDRVGLVLTWARYGGPEDTIWEIFWSGGDKEHWYEGDLEVLSESR